MPVIPFSPLDRRVYEEDAQPVTDRAVQRRERDEEEDARRYREASDAKLQELFAQKVKTFDPKGGTSPVEAREPVTGGWKLNAPGVETPNPYLISDSPDMRGFVPSEGDEMWGQFEQDRIRKADPEDVGYWVGGGNKPMGAGGPERPVTGLSPEEIDEIRKWRASRDQDQSDLKMRQAIGSADKSPDEVARTIELAERTGANRLEVQEDPKGFEQADIMSRVQGLRQSAPKLRSWLDDPINLEVAHDDVESLGWWEQTAAFFSPGNLSLDKVGQALQSGFVDKIPEQLYGLDQMLGDANASIYKALPDWFPGKFGLVNEQVQRSLMADMKRQEMAAQGKANAPVGETWLERGIYGAAQSAPSTLVSLAITAVTKSPVVGSGSMGATTAGGAYGEARDEGKSLGDAFRYALTQGGIETATEFIPLKFLVDDLAKDTSFAKTFFRQAAAEGITEQAATFLQDASTFIELSPDKTLGDFLAERPNAALETLVASTIMSGVTTTVAKGMQAAGDQLDQNAKQKRAEELAKFIDKAVDNGANSKLLKRGTVGADKYREAVAASTDAKFRIDSDAITALAQEEGVTVEQIAQAFRIDPDEMVTAIDTGSDVLVPVGNYVAAIQTAKKEIGLDGGAIHTALGPNMRVGENDLTAREQASMASAMEDEAKARAETVGEEMVYADAVDRVGDSIMQQVRATGRYNESTAFNQAELLKAIVTTLPLRMNADPEALWKEQGFDIVASLKGEQPEADSLPQSVAEDATPTQRLIDMRAKGMKNPEIAAALYPDVDTQTAVNRVKALASKNKGKIEERRAALEGAKSLAQGEQLEQTQRGTFTPREDRNVIRLFESANLSTLAHEGSHWYLDTLWRMSKTESPHPFVLEQLAAILEWHGKSPNWDAMFNPDGSFTKEGVDLQEAFAESFEAYLMEGKAPTTALRSVFASFKQWLLSIYKGIVSGIGGRANLNDEIRQVFDRMLATDEAIKAVHTGLARDGEAMAKAILDKQDPDGKWKPERREKFMERMRERYAAARERAEAALMARLMDEFQRTKQAAWNDEQRQVRREVQSEVDERPEQRAYSWLTGIWRETRADLADEAATEAEAMTSLPQTLYRGIPTKPPKLKPWARDPATIGLSTQDYLEYIYAKHPSATTNQTSPYFAAASTIKWHKGDRDAAQQQLDQYAAYLKRTNAEPEVIENAVRTARAVVDVDPMFFDEAVFNARMKSQITAEGEGLFEAIRKAMPDDGIAAEMRAEELLDEDEDIRPTGPRSLNQTVQPSRQLEDGPAAFGLTPEQAKKVNPIYNPKTLPVERLPSNQDAALWLEGNYIGDPVTDLTAELSDEQIKEIATIMAAEAQLALGNTGNAFTWYSSALAKALDIISIKYPMLADDASAAEAGFGTSRNARFAFTYIMAVTSQNLDVAANSVATDKAFADMLKRVRNGDFTMPRSWGTGDKQKAMGENFAKFGPLINKMPGDDFPSKLAALDDLFRVKMTVKEWVAYMKQAGVPYNKPGQTAMDAVVYGSSLLGPKIGNGFWQNLNGNYDPMTIDLWMRRTWGRLTGKSIGNPAALPEQRARLAGAIKRSRSREQGKPDHIAAMAAKIAATEKELDGLKQADFASKKEFTAEEKRLKAEIKDNQEALADLANLKAPETWSAEYNTSNDALLAYAKRLLKAWNVEYERLKEASNSGTVPAEAQPTWARAAKTIITNLAKPLDQVANGTQRKQIERAGKEALQILKARGIALTTADLQAILWYPEKELWGSLTAELETDEDGDPVVPPSSLNESYDTAFSRILKEQGYEVQGTSGDGSGEPGAGAVAGQDAGPQRFQSAGGSGTSGGAAAGRRSDAAGPQSLAQTVGEPRQLDAMGFYSAAQEAAQRVPDGIWQMGWQAARNSLAKGRGTSRPSFAEMDQLGMDDAVAEAEREAGAAIKGPELRALVLDVIAANRIMIERADSIFDPAKARAAIRKMNKRQIWDSLDTHTKGWFANRWVEARVERDVRTFTLDTSDGDTIVLQFKEGEMVLGYSGDPMRVSSVDIPVYRSFTHMGLTNKPLVETITIRLGVYEVIPASESKNLLLTSSVKYAVNNRIGELFAELAEETVIRKTLREDMVDSVPLVDMGSSGDGVRRLDPGDYDIDDGAKSGEIRMLLPARFHDDLTGSTHSGEPGEAINILWSIRKDADGNKSLFLRQLQSDEAQQLRREKEELLSNRDGEIQVYMTRLGKTRAEAEEAVQQDIDAMLTAPLLARTSLWVNAGVRALVFEAAKQGMGSVSIPTAQTSYRIQGNADAAQHYETNVKGALEKIARQMNAGVKTSTVQSADNPNGATVYTMQITPEMRRKIVSKGFPLFQTGDDKGRATPPPNLPPMRLNLQAVRDQYGEAALADIPPDVAAYSAEANDVEAYVQIARDVRKTLNETPPKSLWKFLSTPRNIGQGEGRISYRGIRDTDGELLKIIGEKKAARGLIADPTKDSKRSRSYDMQQAIEAAWEAGYFDGEDLPTPAQFLDTLRADIDGQAPRYRRDDIPTVSTIAGAERWKEWFDQNGIDIQADVATLRATLPTVLTGQGETAIGPDEAAEVFNGVIGSNAFPTGFDLLKALKQGPLRDKLIRELTQQRMIERNGDVFRDGTIMAEAEAYARNEVQHRQFEIELEALAEAAGKGTAGALAKQTAIENLRSKQVREVLNYTQWLTLERRWAEKAIKAAAKGDTAQAAEFARFRLINSHQYVEGKKLAEKIEKAVKHAKSFDGKDKRIRLSKAGPDYIQQIDQILEGYEFKPVTRKKEAERTSLREWFAAKQAALDPMVDLSGLSEEELMAAQQEEIERSDALAAMQADANVQNYKSLTVEELMAVSDQLDMIERMARKEGALLVEGERRLLSLALDDIEAQAMKAKPEELPPESYASYAPKEKNKRGFKEFFAELRTMQSIVRMIDGIDNGPLAKSTIRKLNTAGAIRTARMQVEEERVVALFREAYGINLDVLRKDQVRIPGIAVPLAKMERLTVALYWGTEISRRRIMDGYGWDQATVQRVLDTLDQKDWAFVSSVWDYVNSLYPEANQAHQDVHHVPLSKQPGLPIVTRFGVIQGSYFPIKYNPHQSSRADQQALTDTAKQITGRAGTRKATSSTKARVQGKVTMPVLLDFYHTLASHVNEVVGNITMQRAILDAGRVIAHPRTQKLIVSRYGWVTYKTLMSAMKDTRNGLAAPNGPTERIAVRIRNGATNVTLGLNIGTVVKQLIGFTTTAVRLGGPRAGAIGGIGWMLRGAVRMGFGAQGMQNGVRFILERSPYMRVRMQVMNQAIADQQRRINEGNIKADAKRAIDVASFFMTQRVQFLGIDSPTWMGAYEKFTASGMSETDAAASADQVVIDAQGSGEIWQVSAFQRGGPIQRIFTNYITAAVANWNLAVNTTLGANFRNPGQVAIWAMNMGVLMTVPVVLSMAVGHMMSPGGGDDDEPLEEQLIREQIAFLLGPLGLFGQLSGAAAGFAYKGPQGTRAFEEASKVITETFTGAERVLAGTATTKDAIDILRPANMAAGVWLGYPAAALDRFVRGAEALASGKTEDPKALIAGPPRE